MDRTKTAVGIFDKLAQLYQDKYMDVGLYHDTLDLFCQSIQKQNPEILELACGPGNITQYLLKIRPDFKILGTDLAPKMLDLARKNNPQADFAILDCREIKSLGKPYDAIMCGFALPYISKEDTLQLIADAWEILENGGILYLSTMEDDYEKSGLKSSSTGDQMYQYFHQADYLTQALLTSNFRILHQKRQDYPTADGKKVTDLIIIAGK